MTDQAATLDDLDDVQLFSEGVLADPYAVLARLRANRPVGKFFEPTLGLDQYVVSSYALVDRVFRDNKTFSSRFKDVLLGGSKVNPEAAAIYASGPPEVDSVLTSDEPDHTRLRNLAQKAFMPGRIKRMSALIGETITRLIDCFIERGECDFLREFAVPLPINSAGSILGVDPAHADKIYDWTFSLTRRIGKMTTPEEEVIDARNVVEMMTFIGELIAERRTSPRDDLLSDLVTSHVDGVNPLSDLEILSTLTMLLNAGAETTRSTLMSLIFRLLTSPDQLETLRRDPSLTNNAIEEVLRIDSPGTAIWRIANDDVELGGVRIPKGGVVMLRMDSANRDEHVFANADRFDITRPNASRHLSFGAGIHYCIGHRLAREQLVQSVHALLARLSNLHLIREKCDFRTHLSVQTRCLRAVHLGFDPGPKLLN